MPRIPVEAAPDFAQANKHVGRWRTRRLPSDPAEPPLYSYAQSITCDFSLCVYSRAAATTRAAARSHIVALKCDTQQGMPWRSPQLPPPKSGKVLVFCKSSSMAPLTANQGWDGAWPRCTDVGGGSIKLGAVHGTSGLGQMQPIFPVTGEELDIDTPIERMSTIQGHCRKYSRAIALPSLLLRAPQREIPTRIFKPRWLTLRTTPSLRMDHVHRPRTVKRLPLNRHAATETRRVWSERLQCLQ